MSPSDAANNAVRLLQMAEGETNLQLMDMLIRIAEIWVQAGTLLRDLE